MDAFHFTTRVRSTLEHANHEAAALQHEYIGTEHLLLAILRDGESAASRVLARLGADAESLRAAITGAVKVGSSTIQATEPRPYTSRATQVLELAMIDARNDNRAPVGTQHLLLGMLREQKGIAAQLLTHAGLTLDQVKTALGEGSVQEP